MKILIIHNHYRQRAGEDAVVEAESCLLRQHGHTVIPYLCSNDELAEMPPWERLSFMFRDALWNNATYLDIKRIARKDRPDIAHVHNVFLKISPSVYSALSEEDIPIVQTVHNYRFLCPKGTFYRNGKVCEKCISGNFFNSVIHRCWRGSAIQSFFLQRILRYHRRQKTFTRQVDRYIMFTDFLRKKFSSAGIDSNKMVIKPNFVDMEGISFPKPPGRYALFVGRLVEEKGVITLLRAWKSLADIPLKISGDGELLLRMQKMTAQESIQNVEILGRKTNAEVKRLMREAIFLIFPSAWYEGFPVTIVEAFASGLPVITSRLGSMAEIVSDGKTGLHFSPGDSEDLSAKVRWAWDHPQEISRMSAAARSEYERKYTPEKNCEQLLQIYTETIVEHKQKMFLKQEVKV